MKVFYHRGGAEDGEKRIEMGRIFYRRILASLRLCVRNILPRRRGGRREKKWLVLMICFYCINQPLLAGKYAVSFLEIGVGARALGMGGAFCSVANDGTSFYWNPAGLAFIQKPQLSGMYGPQFGSFKNPLANYHFVGYTHPLPGNAVLAVNWTRLAVDDIPVYNELEGSSYWDRLHHLSLRPSGEPEGYIGDTEDALYFSFAMMNNLRLDMGWQYHKVKIDFPVGINLKWVRQSIGENEASGLGLDAGAMIRFHLSDFFETNRLGNLSFGIYFRDMAGTTLSWNTRHQDSIPSSTRWGLSYQQPLWGRKNSLCFSFDRDLRWNGEKHWGIEYFGFGILGLRLGIDQGNFTAGAGFKFWIVQVDYAFLSHELGSLHRISCSITI